MDLVRDAALLDLLREKERIRGSGAQNGRFEIHHHLQLLVSVAGSHRNCHCAKFLAAVLETDSCCPEAVTGRDMDAVLFGDARKLIAALEHLAPVIYVLGGIRDDHGHAGRAGGRVDTDHFILFAGHESQRIRLAKILLLGKRKLQEFFHSADVIDAGLLEALSVEIVSGDQTLDLMVYLCQLFFINLHFYILLNPGSMPVLFCLDQRISPEPFPGSRRSGPLR